MFFFVCFYLFWTNNAQQGANWGLRGILGLENCCFCCFCVVFLFCVFFFWTNNAQQGANTLGGLRGILGLENGMILSLLNFHIICILNNKRGINYYKLPALEGGMFVSCLLFFLLYIPAIELSIKSNFVQWYSLHSNNPAHPNEIFGPFVDTSLPPPLPEKKFRGEWRHRRCAFYGNRVSRLALRMPTLVCLLYMLTNTTLHRLGFVNSYILIAFLDLNCSCRDNKLSISGRILFWIGGKIIRRYDPLEWAWTKERQIRTQKPSAVFIRGNSRISCKGFAEGKRALDCKCFLILVLPA